jgi:transposase
MSTISESKRRHIEKKLRNGWKYAQIAERYGVSKASISRIANLRSLCIPLAIRRGRPRVLNARQERFLIRSFVQGECLTAKHGQAFLRENYNIDLSISGIKGVLRRNGLRGRVRRKKPRLLTRHRRERLAFARRHRNWTVDDWKQVFNSSLCYAPLIHTR